MEPPAQYAQNRTRGVRPARPLPGRNRVRLSRDEAMVQAPIDDRSGLLAQLECEGFALVQPEAACRALQLDLAALDGLRDSWERLPRDQYLRDGGHYRSRRHSCFVQTPGVELLAVPHRAHWQPTAYNALHGGMQRWFEPLEDRKSTRL